MHARTHRGGKRLADEIVLLVKEPENSSLRQISIMGNSLGGLYARYAIALLYDPNSKRIAGLEPVCFATFASPHLGLHGLVPKVLEKAVKGLPLYGGRSVQQMFMVDATPVASDATPVAVDATSSKKNVAETSLETAGSKRDATGSGSGVQHPEVGLQRSNSLREKLGVNALQRYFVQQLFATDTLQGILVACVCVRERMCVCGCACMCMTVNAHACRQMDECMRTYVYNIHRYP